MSPRVGRGVGTPSVGDLFPGVRPGAPHEAEGAAWFEMWVASVPSNPSARHVATPEHVARGSLGLATLAPGGDDRLVDHSACGNWRKGSGSDTAEQSTVPSPDMGNVLASFPTISAWTQQSPRRE